MNALASLLKRLTDIVVVVISTPLTVPLCLAIAWQVQRRLGRPVLFRQTRCGLNGKPFQMFKFRSMTDARDADGQLQPDAARLTTFGRWLRASSLDELPELWNILKGDMSLVGPRPLLMAYLPRYTHEQARRHSVKPGLTGLAQVRGRNAISWETKLALDVWYVDHRSLWLDFRLLSETAVRVLRRDGIQAKGYDTMPEFLGSPTKGSEQGENR